MKRIITLGLLGLLSISCSRSGGGDDDNESVNENSIVGKWIPVKETFNGKTIHISHECHNKKDYMQFYNNGNGEIVEYNNNCYESGKNTFTYYIEGNKLYTSVDGVVIIRKLSSNKLILEKNDTDLDGDGRKDVNTIELTK